MAPPLRVPINSRRPGAAMIDHFGFPVSDFARSKAFYEKALAPLGYMLDHGNREERIRRAGRGLRPERQAGFLARWRRRAQRELHIAFVAKERAAVDAFYNAAIAAGGKDNGAPGPRPNYRPELLRGLRDRRRWPQHRGGVPRLLIPPAQRGGCRAQRGGWGLARVTPTRPPATRRPPSPFGGGIRTT